MLGCVPGKRDRDRGAHAEHVAGSVVDDERDGDPDEERVEHRASARPQRDGDQNRERSQHDRRGAEARGGAPDGELDPVGDVACEGERAVADGDR